MSSAPRGERLIIGGGSPRSGTSMVQIMLDSHPEIYGGPEFDHLHRIANLRQLLQASIINKRIDSFCTLDEVDTAFAEMIEKLLLRVADDNGKKFLCEMTPMNIAAFPTLLDILSGAKFVHVIRDPRAVINSMLQVGKRGVDKNHPLALPDFTQSAQKAIPFLMECTKAAYQAIQQWPGRVYTVVYEKIVTDPQAQARSLCEFLGVPFDEAMLRAGEAEHPSGVHLDGVWYDRKMLYRSPEPVEMEKWRHQLAPEDQTLIRNAFRNNALYKQLGYRID